MRISNGQKIKPWCNYAVHRTTSERRACGGRTYKVSYFESKRSAYRRNVEWWKQASNGTSGCAPHSCQL